ncbi:MAG: tetratricopeptide repeat protein [Candidatus Marinimicrobia bacterium]|nr:tetratricopeptide repeat protein [Candidatus Neomarinimicrobiota bacterium]
MRSTIFGLFVLLLLLSCGSQELVTDSHEKKALEHYPTSGITHFMYGEIYRSSGNYSYANLEYRKALEYDTSTTILNAIGESYRLLGKHKQATNYFEKSLKLDPTDATAQFNVLDLYMKELQYEKAIPILVNELENKPNNSDYLQRLAECYRGVGQHENALTILGKLINLSPNYPWSYIYAAEIMLEDDRIADAAPYLEQVARNIPPNNELYEFWVRALFESNNIEGMLSALEFWLNQDPESLSPYFIYIDYQFRLENYEAGDKLLDRIKNRWQEDVLISYFQGVSAMSRNDVEKVWFYFKRADEFPDPGVDLYLYYGLWFWEKGYLEEAETVADLAIEKRGPGARWLHMKAMISAQWGNYEKAEQLLLSVISIDSTNLNAREDLANIYVEMNEAEKADQTYKDLLIALPENVSVLNNYAYVLACLNMDLGRAMDMVNKALKQEKSAAYCDTKAWVLYRQNKYNQAWKWIKKAFEYSDVSADVFTHQGHILIALNKTEEARIAFLRSLKIDPDNIDATNALEELK